MKDVITFHQMAEQDHIKHVLFDSRNPNLAPALDISQVKSL